MGVNAKKLRMANSGYPLLLFLVGLGLSALVGYWQHRSIDADAKKAFERMSVRAQFAIALRLDKSVQALQSVRALYAASDQVRRDEFRRFIMERNMERDFPGVRGFSFIQQVQRSELSAFVAAEKRDDAPDFAIRQLVNKDHPDLFVVKFIEPAASNKGVQGLDIGSEPVRRFAIQQAINTGAPTVSGAITLVQDNKKSPGLLLFVPVYQNRETVGETCLRVLQVGEQSFPHLDVEIVFVDDGAQDGSWEELERVRAENPDHVSLVKLSRASVSGVES